MGQAVPERRHLVSDLLAILRFDHACKQCLKHFHPFCALSSLTKCLWGKAGSLPELSVTVLIVRLLPLLTDIRRGQKGQPEINSLAYWAHSQITKKIKGCGEDSCHSTSFCSLFMNAINKLKCFAPGRPFRCSSRVASRPRLDRQACNKSPSLLGLFGSYVENEGLWLGLHFVHNE